MTLRKTKMKDYERDLEITTLDTTVKYLFDSFKDGEYIDNPDYQRGLVWDLEQKQSYILNLYQGFARIEPTIAIYYNEDYSNTFYEVVDGKQRLNAIMEFINNDFYLTVDGNKFFFKDLSDEDKKYLLKYPVKYRRIMSRVKDNERIPKNYLLDIFTEMNFLGTTMSKEDFERVIKLRGK